MKICIVAGARPNFVKIAPIVWAVDKRSAEATDLSYELVYVGTPDDVTLEPSLFNDLQIPPPSVFLGVDSTDLNELTGQVMSAFERHLRQSNPNVVIVVDDLASTMAAAIVTKKAPLPLAHLVAGTRSFDISMPKEINRLVIDGLSDLLFTAGVMSNSILSREGAENEKVFMVGNILIDCLRHNRERFLRPEVLEQNNIADGNYLVLTLNRKALLSNAKNLKRLLTHLLQAAGDTPIIAPLRPSARKVVQQILPQQTNIIFTQPLDYLHFGYLTLHAQGIITDSGNVSEEATFNRVPCITLNSYTEHMETVTIGTNVLVGEDADRLSVAVEQILQGQWKKGRLPERWDGRTAERIVYTLISKFNSITPVHSYNSHPSL